MQIKEAIESYADERASSDRRQEYVLKEFSPSAHRLIIMSPEMMILDKRNSVLPDEPLVPLANVEIEKRRRGFRTLKVIINFVREQTTTTF